MQQQTIAQMEKFIVVEDGRDPGMIIEDGQLNDDGMDMVYAAIEQQGVIELETKESIVSVLNTAFQEELRFMVESTPLDQLAVTYQEKVASDVLEMMEDMAFGEYDVVEEALETTEKPDQKAELLLKEEEELARLDEYGIAPGMMVSTPSGGDMFVVDINVMEHETSLRMDMASGETRFVDAEYVIRQIEHAKEIDREDEMYQLDRDIRDQYQKMERKAQRKEDDNRIRNNEMFQKLRRFRRNGNVPDNSENTPVEERQGIERK